MVKKNIFVIILVLIFIFMATNVFAATTFTLYGDCGQMVYEQDGEYICYYEGVSIASRTVDYIDVAIDVYEDGVLVHMDGAIEENAQTVSCQTGNYTDWEQGHVYQVFGDHYANRQLLLRIDEASTTSYFGV